MEALFNSPADNKLALAKRASEQDKNHEAIARTEYITQHYNHTNAALEACAIMIGAFAAQGKQIKVDSLHKPLSQREINHQLLNENQDS